MKIEHEAITDVNAVEQYYGEQDGRRQIHLHY